MGVQQDFRHNLLGCTQSGQFYGTTPVCIEFKLYSFCVQRIPVSENGTQYQHQLYFIDFHNIIWRTQPKSIKKHADLQLNRVCTTNINEKLNVLHSVFSSVILWIAQTSQGKFGDYYNKHCRWEKLCCSALLLLTGDVHARPLCSTWPIIYNACGIILSEFPARRLPFHIP